MYVVVCYIPIEFEPCSVRLALHCTTVHDCTLKPNSTQLYHNFNSTQTPLKLINIFGNLDRWVVSAIAVDVHFVR